MFKRKNIHATELNLKNPNSFWIYWINNSGPASTAMEIDLVLRYLRWQQACNVRDLFRERNHV